MLAVALPDIRGDFSMGHDEVAWLGPAYLIAMAVAQPQGGRIGDQIGKARAYRTGLIAFLGFSLAAAVAPSFSLLILARTGQAVMGAIVIPNVMAMLRTGVSPQRLGMARGVTTAALGLSAAGGPVLGALLLEAGSWRLLFFVNVPLVAAGLLCLSLLHYRDSSGEGPVQVDLLGEGYLTGLLVTLTFLFGAARGSLTLSAFFIPIALGAFGLLFVSRQFKSPRPVAEWTLFRIRSYAAATSYVLLSNMVMYTVLLSVPFFIVEIQEKSVGAAGVLLGVMSLLMAILAAAAGWLADLRGRRLPALVGGASQVLAVSLLLIGISADVSFVLLAASLAILGFGIGIGSGPAMTAAMEAAPREHAGVAAGTLSMMRYFGNIVGAGILGGVLASDAATPSIDLFRLIFAILLPVACTTLFSASLIHKLPQTLLADKA